MPAARDRGRAGPSVSNTRPINNMTTGYSYSIKGGPAPIRPPREFVDLQFETAPPVREPPPRNPKRNLVRHPNPGPASTTHSQPPYTANVYTASRALHRRQDRMESISPPSSPEPTHARRPGQQQQGGPRARDVSPIDSDTRVPLSATQPPRSTSRNGGDYQNSQPPHTSIPMMRRARRKESDAALREAQARERQAANQHAGQRRAEVRWDAMTGEPSAAGRPPQVRPAEYAHGLGISSASSPPQRSPSAMMSAFGDRMRRMAHTSKADRKSERAADNDTDPAANAFTSSRPGWRGASGRTAIVEPVHDNLQVAPLRIPPKNTNRAVSSTSVTSPISPQPLGISTRGQTPPVSPPGAETAGAQYRENIRKVVPSSQVATPVGTKHQSDGPSYPSPPLSGSFDRSDAPSIAAQQLQSSIAGGDVSRTPSVQTKDHIIHRKPVHAHQGSVSSVYSQASHPPAAGANGTSPNALAAAAAPGGDAWTQPASRFSITTYATSTANTPRESLDDFDHADRPPVPETPAQYRDSPRAPQQDASSAMDRRRPHPEPLGSSPVQPPSSPQDGHYMSSPFQTTTSSPPPSAAAQQRQAAATGQPAAINFRLDNLRSSSAADSRRASIASSINKSLPPAPPEASAGAARDRAALLRARLSALANRRINITRSVQQMTELMPAADGRGFFLGAGRGPAAEEAARLRQEDERRKVEALRAELAEVRREEYELGIKLHRAYKRLDREDNFEPTTLWVRRVTG